MVATEAMTLAEEHKKKTIAGTHVLQALERLDCKEYVLPLQQVISDVQAAKAVCCLISRVNGLFCLLISRRDV